MNSTGRLSPTLPAPEPPPSLLRGRRYGEDRAYLLVRDPGRALVVWELLAATHARGESAARAAGVPLRHQIRIQRRADAHGPVEALTQVELPDALGGDRSYVSLPRSGGECRALIGFLLPESFVTLLESSWVPVPPDGPCPPVPETPPR